MLLDTTPIFLNKYYYVKGSPQIIGVKRETKSGGIEDDNRCWTLLCTILSPKRKKASKNTKKKKEKEEQNGREDWNRSNLSPRPSPPPPPLTPPSAKQRAVLRRET